MAPIPTVQSSGEKRNVRPLGSQPSGTSERRSELVTRVKYCNTLPDLPFDTKFIAYPFGSNRFVTYSTTSLERNYTYEVLTEADLGVDVELVIPNAYNIPQNAPIPSLDPTDERLLEDDVLPSQKNQKRSRHHAKSVSWLRRTEYISTEQTRFQPQTIDKVEAKVGYSVKKMLKDDLGHYMDRDSQIKSIEKTFEDSLYPIDSHFAKPGVTPVEILPVFPDFKLWKYPCAQVIFDSDPAPVGRPIPAQLEEMSQAMIRGVMDESGEQFVAYFLPTDETLQKRKRDVDLNQEYEDEEVYEYRMAREYNWNVKSKATKGYEENYFFAIREDGVYYNELETRVRLNKRRVRGPNQQLNTKLCVKHIPLAASDYKFQRSREKELEPLAEEEEEEDNKSEEEEENKSEEEENNKSDEDEGKKSDEEEKKSEDEDSKSEEDNKSSEEDEDNKSDEDEGNKSEDEGNKSEDEGNKSEDEGNKSEDEGNKSEDEGKKSEQEDDNKSEEEVGKKSEEGGGNKSGDESGSNRSDDDERSGSSSGSDSSDDDSKSGASASGSDKE